VSTEDLLVALAAAGAAAVLALCAPRLLAALPEPEPPDAPEPAEEPDPESQAEPPIEPEPAKRLYAELGATRGLGLRLAAAAAVGAGGVGLAVGAHAVVAVWVYVNLMVYDLST